MSKTVTLLKAAGEDVKTPQIRAMLGVLETKVGIGNAVVLSELYTAIDNDEAFVSRQGAQRVWKFYEKRMVEEGLIEIAGVDEKEKAEKPAKDGKTAAPAEKPQRSASKRAKGEDATVGESEAPAEA